MNGLPPDTHLGAVHLAVADVAQTSAFYRDVLGYRAAGEPPAFSASGAPPYDLVLHSVPGRVRSRTAGLYHFAILLPARADLARALRHLIEAGAPIEGASDHAVSEAVYLHDPEGNGIEIYADRPRERWPTPGGRLEMTTKPLDLDDLFRSGPGAWKGMPAGTRIGHIHLRVNDLGRAEGFYAAALGFDVMVRGYPGALFVAAGGYHHHIGLNTWAGRLPAADPDGLGLRYFTVVLPDRDARDAVLARARAAGVDVTRIEAARVEAAGIVASGGAASGGMASGIELPPGGPEGVLLRDPDGIGVVLAA